MRLTLQLSKVFAVLLFSFELLAPAVLQAGSISNSCPSQETVYSDHAPFLANLLTALVCEEVGSEEEDESKGKVNVDLDYFGFVQFFFDSHITARLHPSTLHVEPIATSQPPLFALHHSFLI